MISTNELLSTIIHATLYGCTTIRKLSTVALLSGDSDGTTSTIQYKQEGDARSALTIADIAAQRVIVGSLLHKWGSNNKKKMKLNIVGEEDDTVQQEVVREYVRELDECLLEHSNLTFYLPDGDSDEQQELLKPTGEQ